MSNQTSFAENFGILISEEVIPFVSCHSVLLCHLDRSGGMT
ncbi:MAG: hypothetical protein ACI9JY_000122, partial [Saprospiraceae bacterium]